jgi:hypothetical protein
MKFSAVLAGILLFAVFFLTGCRQVETMPVSTPVPQTPVAILSSPTDIIGLSAYAFPRSIEPDSKYLFYLHGKIIEDQGIPAVSPEYGEYEYEAILQKFVDHGFTVISEQRPRNTDSMKYAERVAGQVKILLGSGVPAKNVTIVGASKGAGITIEISHLLENLETNFVIMAICNPDEVEALKQNRTILYGNVLSIYDSVDTLAGSCREIFALSEGKGLGRHDEIVLHVGTGHGILYQPLDEWMLPSVKWAGGE